MGTMSGQAGLAAPIWSWTALVFSPPTEDACRVKDLRVGGRPEPDEEPLLQVPQQPGPEGEWGSGGGTRCAAGQDGQKMLHFNTSQIIALL